MAPNRKKKKPVANPARGFMTVSVPAKPKPRDSANSVPSAGACAGSGLEKDTLPNNFQTSSSQQHTADLHELSPEQLEKHLEEAELQSLVDEYGLRCKSESARLVLKIESEKRVLRPQAVALTFTEWLPEEFLDLIVETERMGKNPTDLPLGRGIIETRKLPTEADICVRAWTLRETLLRLGFTESRVEEALQHSLRQFYRDPEFSKDPVWILDESFEWLAMECDAGELPSYGKSSSKLPTLPETTTSNLDSNFPRKGNSTPKRGSDTNTSLNVPNHDSHESDSSVDPDSLVEEYVAIQSHLYKHDPKIFNHPRKSKKEGVFSDIAPPPNIAKLMKKLVKIEKDILFDREEAEVRWDRKLAGLRQETAVSLRKQIAEKAPDSSAIEPEEVPNKGELSIQLESSVFGDDGSGDVFGGLFSPEPEHQGTEIGKKISNGNSTITLRDFGKPLGLNPRRVLEDVSQARDAGCNITYRDLSSASYSHRKAIDIRWSKDQNLPAHLPLSMVSYRADPQLTSAEMVSISTPTSLQAESYISIVALFLLVSESPKESRAYMKLPATWRDLWSELVDIKKACEDEVDKKSLRNIQKYMRENVSRFEDDVVVADNFKQRNSNSDFRQQGINDQGKDATNAADYLRKLWTGRASTYSFRKMAAIRMQLPIWKFRPDILEAVTTHQAVIICSETGSGKSTQIPSLILERELLAGRPCKIYVTEPRRISAMSLARRVSEELGEAKEDLGRRRSLVGYAVRLESKVSSSTRLIFATTGVVVRMLERPKEFEDITHLILDEVHERTIDADFLLIVLRRLIRERPELKLILMSATVDTQRFSAYLNNAPVLDMPGRTFPVEVKYLEDAIELTKHRPDDEQSSPSADDSDEPSSERPATENSTRELRSTLGGYTKQTRDIMLAFDEYRLDYKLIVALLSKIATSPEMERFSKAILIFMPGLAEIRRLNDEILAEPLFSTGWVMHTLHSSIATDEQEKAFLVPPKGIRKIVIATNIAETGITIPDITLVIDTGKEKTMRFDERRQLSRLAVSFISRANAKQRRGRAGRVQNGLCFHLFSKHRHDTLLAEQQTPEMLRLSLQDLVLRVKICNLGDVEQTLSEAIDPPSAKNIRRAIEALKEVKALTNSESLTPLGRQLAKLPLDVFLGKLIIYGVFFKCLDASISIAAILSSKSPFVNTMGSKSQKEVARMSFSRGNSDPLTVYNAYSMWKRIRATPGTNESTYCRKKFLSPQALRNIEDIKMQLLVSTVDAGLLKLDASEQHALSRARFSSRQRQFFTGPERVDVNSDNDLIVNSVIAWSFYPKLLVREGKGWRSVANNQAVSIHPTSVNKHVKGPLKWISYYHIMQSGTRQYNAHETSSVEDFAVALLCGDVQFKMHSGIITIDGSRIRFSVENWKSMLAMKILSTRLREIMALAFRTPQKLEQLSDQQQKWLEIWQQVFTHAYEVKKNKEHQGNNIMLP